MTTTTTPDDTERVPETDESREYVRVLIDRDESREATYHVYGLPEGAGFKDAANYDLWEAGTLHVNGVGFAAGGAEFSQHGRTITVERTIPGGRVDLRL